MHDRRAAPRQALKAKVTVYAVDTESDKAEERVLCAGWVHDVSLGGVRLTTRKALPLQSHVEMAVECTHPIESYRIRGQVGWVQADAGHTFAVGVFVRDNSKERLVAWRRMLSRRGVVA